jgi:DnaJ family protein B protein 12
LSKKNYYSILGIEQTASEDEIKKAYKKLAIKLHPDKNHAPQSSDAFKKVSAAYVCLTDKEKKKIYD